MLTWIMVFWTVFESKCSEGKMMKFEEENPGQHTHAECIAIADLAVTCMVQ